MYRSRWISGCVSEGGRKRCLCGGIGARDWGEGFWISGGLSMGCGERRRPGAGGGWLVVEEDSV